MWVWDSGGEEGVWVQVCEWPPGPQRWWPQKSGGRQGTRGDRGAGRLGSRRVRVERLTSRGGHVCGLRGWGQHGAQSVHPRQPLLPAHLPWACRASSPLSAPGALPAAPVPERCTVWAQTARPGPSSGSPEPSQGTPSPVSGRGTWVPCPEAQRGRELGGCQPWGGGAWGGVPGSLSAPRFSHR